MNTKDKTEVKKLVKAEMDRYFKKHPNCRRGDIWTADEESNLIEEWEEFLVQTASLHGRSENAIKWRISKMLDEGDI